MTIQTRNRKKIETNILYEGDCLEVMKSLPDKSIDCILTSPPYWNTFWEKYSTDPAMVSIEPDITSYLSHLISICKECYRVLRDTGVFWVLIGEPNLRNGKCRSNLSGIPWKLAFSLQDNGWILRSDTIAKLHFDPAKYDLEKAKFDLDDDRPWCTHHYVFMFTKKLNHYWDGNRYPHSGDVWDISPINSVDGFTFETSAPDLVKTCICCGCPPEGTVLDPFCGSGTSCIVANSEQRKFIGVELVHDTAVKAFKRISSYSENARFCVFDYRGASL